MPFTVFFWVRVGTRPWLRISLAATRIAPPSKGQTLFLNLSEAARYCLCLTGLTEDKYAGAQRSQWS